LRIVATRAWVRSDRRLLRRLLQNLVANAIKYTPKGKVVVGVRRRGSALSVEVCDTGPGIPKSKRALIFKEFERLEETASMVRGLGLGLSIVERIGRVLGHRIDLRSAPGGGSIFSVDLPIAAADTAVQAAPPLVPAAGRIAGLNVLCIDNEAAVLEGMQALLEGWECCVICAQSVGGAVQAVRASSRRPDIILADYHLDDGTGIAAVATLRAEIGSPVPAIIITADHSAAVQRAVREQGYALLRKPLKVAALRALMFQLTLQHAVAAE
jgi:CheY-like chemotaxis protein/anti-sigma regulatory factor (Ser/Thr protein kinase)